MFYNSDVVFLVYIVTSRYTRASDDSRIKFIFFSLALSSYNRTTLKGRAASMRLTLSSSSGFALQEKLANGGKANASPTRKGTRWNAHCLWRAPLEVYICNPSGICTAQMNSLPHGRDTCANSKRVFPEHRIASVIVSVNADFKAALWNRILCTRTRHIARRKAFYVDILGEAGIAVKFFINIYFRR